MSSPRSIQSTESAEEQKQYPDITQELDAPPSDEEPDHNAVMTVLQTSSPAKSVSVISDYNNSSEVAMDYQNYSVDRLRRIRTLVQKSSSQTLILEAPLIALPDNNAIPHKVKLQIEELKNQVMYLSKMNEKLNSRLNAMSNDSERNVNL